MKLKRERVLQIAMCVLVSLLIPGNYEQTKGEARTSILTAQKRNDAQWGFWHKTEDGVADELFDTKKACKDAEINWSKNSGVGEMIFRCARVDNKLLKEARARCKRKKELACEWAESIQDILERQTTP